MCKARYLLLGIVIPVVYLLPSFGLYWLLFPGSAFPEITLAMIIAIPVNIIVALGGELGWRGVLAPVMTEKFGFVKASIYTGILWGVWYLTFGYFSVESDLAALPAFLLSMILMSFAMNYLRLKSGSIWPAVLLHASYYLIGMILNALPLEEQQAYFIYASEPLLITAMALVPLLGAMLLKRRNASNHETGL